MWTKEGHDSYHGPTYLLNLQFTKSSLPSRCIVTPFPTIRFSFLSASHSAERTAPTEFHAMASFRRTLITACRLLSSSAPSTSATTCRASIAPLPPLSTISPFRRYSTENAVNIDLSDEESKRRLFNRLLYRSKQRGFLELDLVLGKWVEENIHSMDENGIKALVHLLDLENPDLWKWLTGQEQPPETVVSNPVFLAVHDKIKNNLDSYASPETRAVPGQPWVKGWDDIKKGPYSPVAGNQ